MKELLSSNRTSFASPIHGNMVFARQPISLWARSCRLTCVG
uniref:Uncharacterized protein n=1 Tax=Rhizophora mucronata TaxID=61149 RepID=A0A2P2LH39_RHIMU